MRVRVRVTPRASRARVAFVDGVLRIWVTAPPAEGRANEAAREAIASALGLRPADVAIERGARSRDKLVSLPDGAAARLRALGSEA